MDTKEVLKMEMKEDGLNYDEDVDSIGGTNIVMDFIADNFDEEVEKDSEQNHKNGNLPMPGILDGELFEVISSEDNGAVVANCKLCPKICNIKGNRSSTGNFIRHVKLCHPTHVQRLCEKRSEKKMKGKVVLPLSPSVHSFFKNPAEKSFPTHFQKEDEKPEDSGTVEQTNCAEISLKRRITHGESRIAASEDIRNTVTLLNKGKDNEKIFGAYVASELRQLKFDKYKRKLKGIISRAIINVSELDATEYESEANRTVSAQSLSPSVDYTTSHSSSSASFPSPIHTINYTYDYSPS